MDVQLGSSHHTGCLANIWEHRLECSVCLETWHIKTRTPENDHHLRQIISPFLNGDCFKGSDSQKLAGYSRALCEGLLHEQSLLVNDPFFQEQPDTPKIYGSAVPTQFPYDFALHKCECYIVTYQIILIIIRIHSCRAKFACRDDHDQTSCLGTYGGMGSITFRATGMGEEFMRWGGMNDEWSRSLVAPPYGTIPVSSVLRLDSLHWRDVYASLIIKLPGTPDKRRKGRAPPAVDAINLWSTELIWHTVGLRVPLAFEDLVFQHMAPGFASTGHIAKTEVVGSLARSA
ncbi:hypothetical protein FCULG_00002424 [Fusarium culmorum]|uniref:Uncharacterized protein n=1 Tax=Fusarium culmorum TaxID=5516 RepID=A0A2T4GNX1_FUSCU|nr:hypothetical protein FCULG_00002424 [Fusarium culmorum]